MQVVTLMWMHTVLNYQYKHGTALHQSVRILWSQGGVPRFYRGVGFALTLAPATRFVDTAANGGILAFLDTLDTTEAWPLWVKTACGSTTAGVARFVLLPLDVAKTVLQVEGRGGWPLLKSKLKAKGFSSLFHGGGAACGASVISHYPWFLVVCTQETTFLKQY
jgi:hypothetical protein